MLRWSFFVALFLAGATGATYAQPVQFIKTENVTAQLISETVTVRPGTIAWIAFYLKMRPGWHTYWVNPGDAGEPADLRWHLPLGYETGAIAWPAPRRFDIGPITTYGYKQEAILQLPLKVPADARPGERVKLSAEATWLVCEQICIPESGSLSLSLFVGESAAIVDERWSDIFARAREALPKDRKWSARFSRENALLKIFIEGAPFNPDAERILFFPSRSNVIVHSAQQSVARISGGLLITVKAGPEAAKSREIEGVLSVSPVGAETLAPKSFRVSATASPSGTLPAGPMGKENNLDLPLVLLLAFGGGLVLNVMPCVFSILSLKAVSFTGSGSSDGMWRHGLTYSAGVMTTFALVGGVLVAVQQMSLEAGWKFQLQEPIFVMVMVYVMFAMGLSLSGLFDIGTALGRVGGESAARTGHWASFRTGSLAVVVSSPCTAPFMALAIGFALSQPWPILMGVMLALSMGLALPFLLLSASPPLARLLPRPGPWLTKFKQALAFPMYGTAAWLVWVLSQQAGNGALLAVLAGAILIGFAAWLWSVSWNWSRRGRLTAAGISVVALLGALTLVILT